MVTMKNTAGLFSFCIICAFGELTAQTLSNGQSSTRTQQTYQLLTSFQTDLDQCLILGQNIGWSMEEFDGLVANLQVQTGEWPGMIGGQLRNAPDEINYNALLELLVEWQEKGGLIELSMLPNNPFTGGDIWDISVTNITDLFTSEPDALATWRAELDFYAAFLSALQDRDITVLWRPLMEMNGDWFWYGFQGEIDPQPYINLYRDLYQYYTVEWELNNLIWVYCANTSYDGIPGVDHYYPGGDVVDIVGFDVYVTNLDVPTDQYEKLLSLGKPFAIPEFGPSFMDMNGNQNYEDYMQNLRNNFPETAYTLAWHSWPDHLASWIDNQNAAEAFQVECVLNRAEINAFFVSTSTSVRSDLEIEIFPNPSHGQITLQVDESNDIDHLRMTDIHGKNVSISAIKSGHSVLIDSQEILAGTYFLKIISSGNWFVKKLIIQ